MYSSCSRCVGRLPFQTNANGEVLRFTYNPADQLLTLTDGKNQVTKWNYDTVNWSVLERVGS